MNKYFLGALMSTLLGSGRSMSPDIEIPDSKDETMKLFERDRAQRARFPSRKKRMKAKEKTDVVR